MGGSRKIIYRIIWYVSVACWPVTSLPKTGQPTNNTCSNIYYSLSPDLVLTNCVNNTLDCVKQKLLYTCNLHLVHSWAWCRQQQYPYKFFTTSRLHVCVWVRFDVAHSSRRDVVAVWRAGSREPGCRGDAGCLDTNHHQPALHNIHKKW